MKSLSCISSVMIQQLRIFSKTVQPGYKIGVLGTGYRTIANINASITSIKEVTNSNKVNALPFWMELNKTENLEYPYPTRQEITKANGFFNHCKVKFEWSNSKFEQIPSERARLISQTIKNPKENKIYGGRTGIPFELINPLPEIVFMGRSNAGKSTLLNTIVTELKSDKLIEAARSSKKAGFTKTLNCFNVGNKFRIIDTPGYGFNSNSLQGKAIMEYLQKRKELLRCYVLISGNHGFTQQDKQVIDLLISLGHSFDIVFTKMDKAKNLEQISRFIEESGVKMLPSLPRLIFTNSLVSKTCKKRYGIDILRSCIMSSCVKP